METIFDIEIQKEFHNAQVARENGNEGRARVCARRAAGAALKIYFSRQDLPFNGLSAFELLQVFIKQPGIPSSAMQNAVNLTLSVSESFQLPVKVDLIYEAHCLCELLEKM